MNSATTLLFLFASLFLLSCGSSKIASTDHTKAKKRSVKFLLRQLEDHHIDFDWFGCKSKIKFEDKNRKASFQADIRMKKDSIIWIRIKKMNVEGARIRITPEHIEVLDRQKSDYFKRNFSYLKDEFGLELSFTELQELVIGNPILFQDRTLISTIKENQNVLKTPEGQKAILQIFMHPANFQINELQGSMSENSISIQYSDYEVVDPESSLPAEKQRVPNTKKVNVDSDETGEVDIQLSYYKLSINKAQKVSFKIPDSYQKR